MDLKTAYLLEKISGNYSTDVHRLVDELKRKKFFGRTATSELIPSNSTGLKVARCWEGFTPVPGKKPYSNGSCRKTQTTHRGNYEKEKQGETVTLDELLQGLTNLKTAAGTTTVYFASPNRQLVSIPKDTVVSTDSGVAYQMGRFYPETKESWGKGDVSGSWTGGTPQPSFKAGRLPSGKPTLYSAEVSEADLAPVSNMVKAVRRLRRITNVTQVKQSNEKED